MYFSEYSLYIQYIEILRMWTNLKLLCCGILTLTVMIQFVSEVSLWALLPTIGRGFQTMRRQRCCVKWKRQMTYSGVLKTTTTSVIVVWATDWPCQQLEMQQKLWHLWNRTVILAPCCTKMCIRIHFTGQVQYVHIQGIWLWFNCALYVHLSI